jgi:hypothetical protein
METIGPHSYASGPHTYWTGYFTSRAALKGYVRESSAYLQVDFTAVCCI